MKRMVRDCANVLLLAKISFLLSSQNGSTTYQLEPLFLSSNYLKDKFQLTMNYLKDFEFEF
jgi:hypothetical protein